MGPPVGTLLVAGWMFNGCLAGGAGVGVLWSGVLVMVFDRVLKGC